VSDLASIGRTLAANDPQGGVGTGEGDANDRNVELLVKDPREPGPGGSKCLNLIAGTPGDDNLDGTPGPDKLRGRRGGDVLRGMRGDDCLGGARGGDRLSGGDDDDNLRGARGEDNLIGGEGADGFRGGKGPDTLKSADGKAETVRCGPGRDVAMVDPTDTTRACEVVRPAAS
jgi:Ca2+-binding RTX toxin-like protein